MLCAGGVLVPVNTRFTGREALDIVRRSDAVALAVAGPFLGRDLLAELTATAGGAVPGLRSVLRIPIDSDPSDETGTVLWREIPERANAVPENVLDARVESLEPDAVSDILFTSGTTGRSKSAMSAQRQSLAIAAAWAEHAGLTPSDRYLVINPFFHTFGYKAGMLAALLRGSTLLPQRTFDPESTFRIVETERVAVLPGAPTIYQTMLDHPSLQRNDLTSLRLAVTGSATVPVALVRRMQRELGFEHVLTAYGLTEAVCATMCRWDDDAHTVAHTSGRATAGFEVRAVSAGGESLPAGEPGEVLLRGPNTMLGYLDDPEATAAAFDTHGWLRTGDVGCLDDRGHLTIVGRIKDVFTCGGFNVYPAEVEQVLALLPGITEAAVVGVPEERLGEVGKTYVVSEPGLLSEQDVIDHCREHLANFKVPRRLEFVPELPRNASGEVLKRLLGTGKAG